MSKISVIGLGYVGLVSAVCFRKLGHEIIGVDINEQKIATLKLGKNPLPEVGHLEEYLRENNFEVSLGNHKQAILNSDISFVCIETPCKKNGSLNLMPLKKACRLFGKIINDKKYHIFVIRSTIFPGSLEILKKEIEKYSKKKCGVDFDIATNPEFLREKTAIADFFDPSYVVVGADKKEIGEKVMACYNGVNAKKFIVDNNIAQMIKYANNSWHACKIAFTNEIGNMCHKLRVDGDELMKLFCEDTKLNINKYYHRIGEPFGGHCLKGESLIQTRKGLTPIKDINIGDIVYGHDGKLHRVTNKFERVVDEDLIKVKPKGFFEFSLTNGHPVWGVVRRLSFNKNTGKLYQNRIKDWESRWILSEDLKRGDYLMFPILREEKRLNYLNIPFKHDSNKICKRVNITGDFLRLLGYYLAEGSLDKKRVSFAFHEKEIDYIKDIKDIAKNSFNLKVSKVFKNKGSKVSVIRINSNRFRNLIEELCGKGSSNKKIDNRLMEVSIFLQKDLIKGMWRGDGSKSKGVWSWTTVSRELFNQMKILLMRQRISFTCNKNNGRIDNKGVKHKTSYTIGIKNYSEIKKMNELMGDFSIKKNLKEKEHKTIWIDGNYIYFPISYVGREYFKGKVYNLEVEDVHSYLGENSIFHNCLVKDTSVLQVNTKKLKLKSYLINSLMKSNEEHKKLYNKHVKE